MSQHHSPARLPETSASSQGQRTDLWRSYTHAAGAVAPAPRAGAVAPAALPGTESGGQGEPGAHGPAAEGAVPTGTAPGLVLCAISGREAPDTADAPDVPDTVEGLWTPAFPSPEMVDAAAALLPAVAEAPGTLAEGPRWELTVGPGIFAVACHDWSRRERTAEKQRAAHTKDVDAAVAAFVETGEWPERPPPRTSITSWSRKSRANMVRRLCELDYTPLLGQGRLPAMVTLTYPGDWLTVAPDGQAVKRHMKALRKRYQRAWGEDWSAVWKLEFQHRGAPHIHMLNTPPHGHARTTGERFASWLSRAWAEVVNHPDPEQRRRHERAGTGIDYAEGLRARDPRRVAAYFTKHGMMSSKEYQHRIPEAWQAPGNGPGRFWGVWNLHRATRTVHVTPEDGIQAGRTARRWARAQRRAHQTWKPRVEQATGRVRYRRSRSRVRLLTNGNRGWIAVNNGPEVSRSIARYLEILTRPDNYGSITGTICWPLRRYDRIGEEGNALRT